MNQQTLEKTPLEKDRADLRELNSNYGLMVTISHNEVKEDDSDY